MILMNEKEEMTLKYYTKMAETRNNTHGDPDFWRKEFEEFREFLSEGKILEIGCGGGRDALLFKEYLKSYQYIGIDASPEMIREARKSVSKTFFLEMNMYALKHHFEKNSFDGFWTVGSLLHIPKSRILRIYKRKIDIVLGQIRRIIKPNGIGFIVMKEGKGEKMIYDNNDCCGDCARLFSFYSLTEFSKILMENGFEILESEPDFKNYNPEGNQTIWLKYFVKVKK